MTLELPGHERREGDLAAPGGRLGPGAELPAAGELDELSLDQDDSVQEVDVTATQSDELPESQASIGGEENPGAPMGLDGVGQFGDVGDSERRPLLGSFRAGSLDPARVGADEAVVHRRGEERV